MSNLELKCLWTYSIIVWFVLKNVWTWLDLRNRSDYPQHSVPFVMCHWKPLDCKILTNVRKRSPTHLAERLKYSHQFRFSCSWKVHSNGFTLFKISLSLSMFLFSSTELSALLCSFLYALLILWVPWMLLNAHYLT